MLFSLLPILGEDASEQLGLMNTSNGPLSSGLLPEVLDNQVMYDPSVKPMEHALIGQELVNNEDDDNSSVSHDNFVDREGSNIAVDDSPSGGSNTAIMTPNAGRHVSDELKKELYEWAIKSEHLNLFSWMKGNLIQMRSRVMKGIYKTVPEIEEGGGFEPHLINCGDALHSLLTNVTLVKEDNLSFPHAEDPTLPVQFPELQGNIDIDELHYGEFGQTTLTPLNMTLGIFTTLTHSSRPDAWETLYFHPTGTRDKGDKSIDNANNLHSDLRFPLSSLKDFCNLMDGIEWYNLPWNKKKWSVRMKFVFDYFIRDTPQHDQLCGHYQAANTKMICRHCICTRALGNNTRVNFLKVPVSITSGNMKMSNFTAPMVEEGVNVEQHSKNISHHRVHSDNVGCTKRAAETFREEFLGNNMCLLCDMDWIASYFGAAVQRQSNHSFPQTNFSELIHTTAKKEGNQYIIGMLYIQMLALLLAEGRQLLLSQRMSTNLENKSRKCEDKIDRRIYAIELLLGMEEFLKYDGTFEQVFKKDSKGVLNLNNMVVHFINYINNNLEQSKGEGNNLVKNHMYFHFSQYMRLFGPPMGWDSAASESNHKTKGGLSAGSKFSICVMDGLPYMKWDKKKNTSVPWFPSDVLKFCCDMVLPAVGTSTLCGSSEHKRDDNYRHLLDGRGLQVYPCQILCLLYLEGPFPLGSSVSGFELVHDDHHALVKQGELQNKLYLFDCNAIKSIVAVVRNLAQRTRSIPSLTPPTEPAPTEGRSPTPALSSKKRSTQSTPSLSSLSARSPTSGHCFPKCAFLKKNSPCHAPVPNARVAPSHPTLLLQRPDESMSASSSSASQLYDASMPVFSTSESSVASAKLASKQSALKQPALKPPPALKQPALTLSALQPPALKQLDLKSPALKQSILQQPALQQPTPPSSSHRMGRQVFAHSVSFFWCFYGDGQCSTPPAIQLLHKSPTQSRVWNASPSPTHFFSQKAGRDKKSIHNVCRISVGLVYALVYPDHPDWRSASVDSLKFLLIGLAKMSPECFDDLYYEGNLLPSTEGKVWLAANWVLRTHWFFKTKPPAPAPTAVADSSTTQASSPPSVSFLPSVGVCSSDLRAPVDVTEGTKCSYSSYVTLSLPWLMSPCPGDLAHLNSKAKPVPKLWPTLPDRKTLEQYVAQLWLCTCATPHLWFFLGHIVPLDTLLSDTFLQRLRDRDMDLKYDHIQAPTISFDLDHYNALRQTHPRFQAFSIAVIWKNIRLDNSMTPDPSPVPAAHILCNATKRSQTVKLLKAQFNSCSPSDIVLLPDGKFYKFIETATNPSDWCLPPSKLKTLCQAKYCQAKFIKTHETVVVLGVVDLDLPVELGQGLGAKTLRQVLMGIETCDNWSWPLFLSVNTSSYCGEILALYNNATKVEAMAMLSFLPIFLEVQYGSCVCQWFSTKCLTEMEAFHWDPTEGQVVETAPALDHVQDVALPFFSGSDVCDWELVDDDLSLDSLVPNLTFNLELHFPLQACEDSTVPLVVFMTWTLIIAYCGLKSIMEALWRYHQRVKHSFAKAGMFALQAKLEHLLAQYVSGDTSVCVTLITTYEVLHKTSASLWFSVEQHLCHIHAGMIPWSPQLQVYRDTIDFWQRVVKLRQGVFTSHTVVKHLACKLSLYKGEHCDLPTALLHLKQAYVRELFRGVRIYFSRTNFVRDFNTAIFLDTLKIAPIV
eukprot:jgi/Psemu1/27664/gm1.27664_g